MKRTPETTRTLYCDPGEDFGWCIARDTKLLAGGTAKMWTMTDAIQDVLDKPDSEFCYINSEANLRNGVEAEENRGPVGRIVCEDFRIYPWKAKELAWDRVRTARAIGAITHMCRQFNIPLILQGANIKAAARAAGAEELYWKPLHENRHQNDAIQHYAYFTAVELQGLPIPMPDTGPEDYE
jgi:hypothetical protein